MKRWPLHKAAFWETVPFFRPLLPFAVGIVGYYSTPLHSIALSVILAGLALSFLGYIILVSNKAFQTISFILLHAFLFSAGISLAHFNDARNDANWFGRAINPEADYLVVATGPPAEKESTWKIPVELIAKTDSSTTSITGKAFIYIYKDYHAPTFQKGDSLLVPGDWIPIKNAGNPFEFDYATHCRRNNICYQQFCSADDIRLFATGDPAAAPFTDRAHNWCIRALERFTPDHKTMGLLQAMLLGDEINLDPELRDSFSQTGIIHIIAISGGNVAIFFVVISAILWWMKDKRHLWIKYAIALPLVWFYVIMAGSSPSAIRAAVMFSLLAFGIMLQKNNNSLNQLFGTAFVLLCAQPAWLYSLGFQLSFVAVLSLILFYKPVYTLYIPANRILRTLWSVVAASAAAEILVAPLVVYYFHNFPLMFLVANVAAYIFMGLVLILGIAIIALSWVPAIASIIGAATVFLVTWFDKVITWMQQFNPTALHSLTITTIELLLIYLLVAGMAIFLWKKQRPAIYIAGTSVLLLLCSFSYHQWIWRHQQRLVIYNASHANRVELIRGKQYRVLSGDITITKITYAITPAHITWQSLNRDTSAIATVYNINGKTALILRDSAAPVHVDYLLLTDHIRYKPAELKQRYSPGLVVLGNTLSRKQQSKFCEECAQAGLNVHAVSEQGALIIE